jgi:hypothetical protein
MPSQGVKAPPEPAQSTYNNNNNNNYNYYYYYYYYTAIELSLGGSSPYTNTHKTNLNKYT